ncbi:MAG: DUF835 domain-containing protein [Euryarchaeota archaeon]|nr:DUF835 domain-containing protein [Euryarchaeota archaeon]
MGCDSERILRDLKRALKSDNIRAEVIKIIKKYDNKRPPDRKKEPNFKLKAGRSYFINEKHRNISYEIFNKVIEKGYKGLCISRKKESEIEDMYGVSCARHIWLSSIKSPSSVSLGDLAKLLAITKEFLNTLESGERGVIMIDGAEAIILHSDFTRFIRFIQAIKDSVSERKGVLIIPINLNTLTEKDAEILRSELIEIPTKK